MHPMIELLEKDVLLFDGATGTYAREQEGFPEEPVEQACLNAPERVALLHRAYLMAGCNAIKTNTFAAYPGMGAQNIAQQQEIIRAACRIAHEEARPFGAYVFADIGPAKEAEDYLSLADLFLNEGIDCFLMETLADTKGIVQAARHIKEANANAFIAVSFAANPDGFTRAGESVTALVRQMNDCVDVDAVGLNCVCGPYHMLRLLEQMPKVDKPLLAMPNAGYPQMIDGRIRYDNSPDYYAGQVAACAHAGARILGGCCGTTPTHIEQIARRLSRIHPCMATKVEEEQSKCRTCQSGIRKKLEEGKKPILVELDPPNDADISRFLRGAQELKLAGADAITIADCPIGRARMDSSLLACKLYRELQIETIPHMTCRDRNVNATKALLLGLSMEGVHNVLAVTGDPVPTSDRDSVKHVFQFNSRVMARFVRSLEVGGEVEPFFLCGALNINARNFEAELTRAVKKEASGMEAFLTQPVLSTRAVRNLELARQALKGKIFGGLFPVVSHKNALFLSGEVAGIAMGDEVVRVYEGLDREAGERMALRLCCDAAGSIADYVDGYYIMTPFLRTSLVSQIIQKIRE